MAADHRYMGKDSRKAKAGMSRPKRTRWDVPPKFADVAQGYLGLLEAKELCRTMRSYSLARAAVAALHAHGLQKKHVGIFVRHGIGRVAVFEKDSGSGALHEQLPPALIEVTAQQRAATCSLCFERLLCADDVQWDDNREGWCCLASKLVPDGSGGYAHPSCLPSRKRHCRKPHVQI